MKLAYLIDTIDLIYEVITCNFIYIYNQKAVYIMNGKLNGHIDRQILILMNVSMLLLISNCLVLFK